MDVKVFIQSTPNPNALKFVLNIPIKTEGKVTYRSVQECEHNPLAQKLFGIPNIKEVYFFDNYITVTQDGNGDWDVLEEETNKIIFENIVNHDPNFKVPEPSIPAAKTSDNPEVTKIETILDQTIRPALQMDGGDLHVVSLEGNTLYISYQGACGSCPSSTMGTLKAIENILREEHNPNMVVELSG